MAAYRSPLDRWQQYRPSKSLFFWSCAGCAVATVIVGFAWGGWVTGGSAAQMASEAGTQARAELAAGICADRFAKGPDAAVQLASLKGLEVWNQGKFLEEGGWLALPGTQDPITGAAALCARRLTETKPPLKAASASG